MLFKMKMGSSGSIKLSKNPYSIILFIEEGLNKKNATTILKDSKIDPSPTLLKKYNDKRLNTIQIVPDDDKLNLIKIIKYKKEKLTPDYFRNEAAGLIRSLEETKVQELFVAIPKYSNVKEYFQNQVYYFQSVAEGFHLGNYEFNQYKSDKKKPENLKVTLVSSSDENVKKGIRSSDKLMSAVNFSKDLVNEPAITLTPNELAKRTKSELTKVGVRVTVLNKKQLKQRKMNAILAVGSAGIE